MLKKYFIYIHIQHIHRQVRVISFAILKRSEIIEVCGLPAHLNVLPVLSYFDLNSNNGSSSLYIYLAFCSSFLFYKLDCL